MRKIVSIAVVLTMTVVSVMGFSLPSNQVFAAVGDSKGLEQAIQAVKKVVNVPDSYSDFQHYSNDVEVDGQKQTMWNLTWYSNEQKGGIYASVDGRGQLISFNQYEDNKGTGLATLTKSEGEKVANEFLKKARPDLATNMKSSSVDQYGGSNSFNYLYKLYVKDIPVDFVYAKISVNKFTKKVEAYYMVQTGEQKLNYSDAADKISFDQARDAFLNTGGVSLKYFTYYDYNNKKITIFPAYTSDDQGTAIDSKTGEKVNIYYQNGIIGAPTATADSAGLMKLSKEEFTAEEYRAIEKVSGLISKEKAESIARELIVGLKSLKLNGNSLSKDYMEEKYYWMLNFDKGSASINAQTGELISFNLYNDETKTGKELSEKAALEKGETFVKKVVGNDKWSQLKLQGQQLSPGYPRPMMDQEKYISSMPPIYGNQDFYLFTYVRQVNGIEVNDNRTIVMVNKRTGEIMQYSTAWFDSVTFPSIDQAMPVVDAFDKFNETGKFTLKYILTEKNTPTLVYQFSQPVSYYLEPMKGTRIGYDGKTYKESTLPTYTDISGHWCEATVKALLENGYYISGDKFNPNQTMTQEGFFRYLYSPVQAYYDSDEFYKMLESNGILKKGEKAPNKELTRQDVTKYVVRYLGQDKAASYGHIYKNPFKDSIPQEYMGYVTLANAFGIVKGDKNGKFNGTVLITNSEGATIIYRTLSLQ